MFVHYGRLFIQPLSSLSSSENNFVSPGFSILSKGEKSAPGQPRRFDPNHLYGNRS